ncbi:MAG TPA: DinB family protein [Fimbriimonas sp.]|nr:DinB family protein [Fimbriimonas sp.]
MNRADFDTLLTYSDNCWQLMGRTLAGCPGAWDAEFESTSKWNSIHKLLAHTIAAEERMVTVRLRNEPIPSGYEDRAAADWEGLYGDHRQVRSVTRAYIGALTDEEIEGQEVVIPSIDGRPTQTRSEALFHIVNHESFHRGEVVMALQRLGFDPPNFDFVLLKQSP